MNSSVGLCRNSNKVQKHFWNSPHVSFWWGSDWHSQIHWPAIAPAAAPPAAASAAVCGGQKKRTKCLRYLSQFVIVKHVFDHIILLSVSARTIFRVCCCLSDDVLSGSRVSAGCGILSDSYLVQIADSSSSSVHVVSQHMFKLHLNHIWYPPFTLSITDQRHIEWTRGFVTSTSNSQ